MKKGCFLLFLAALQIIILGCGTFRPNDFSGKTRPADAFLNRKVAIEYPSFQKYTKCPLDEFIKGMKSGKWMKMSDAQWLYNMKNEKYDIYVLFVEHPLLQEAVMFQRVIINGKDVSVEGLVTLFNFTLSEVDRDIMKSNDVSTDGLLTLFNANSPEAKKTLQEKSTSQTVLKATEEKPVLLKEAPKTPAVISVAKETPVLETPMQKMPPSVTESVQPVISATPAITTTTAPAVATPLISKVTTPKVIQKIKVIGNRDSKRYHLPGMKYYKLVKAYHRIVFESEEDAIKAGYHKAPR